MLKKTAGFTLIELLVTMVLLAIIASVAIPGFGSLIEGNRLVTGTNLVMSSIKLARTEAIKRGANVTFSTDGGMANGWCIHTGGAAGDCANNQIRSFESPGNLTFAPSASFDLVFDRRGFLVPQAAQTILISPDNCTSGGTAKEVRVSPVGRTEIDDGVCP